MIHATDKRFLQEIRQPLSCAGALLRLVQLREASQGAQAHAGNGGGDHRNELAAIASRKKSWRVVAERLRLIPGFGGTGFMAKEVLQDLMHTPVLRNAIDQNTWCPAGPGARRGLNRIFQRPVKQHLPEAQALQEMLALFGMAGSALAFFPTLELHDIQFQLCEFDKYERARLGEGRPKALYRWNPLLARDI
jgi:hypothetical protein